MSEKRIRQGLIEKLWRGNDPFAGFPKKAYRTDMQGWNSGHPYLTEAIEKHRPSIVVEIGVWKGMSTFAMAKKMRELEIDGVVIAVDTWLGAWDHWVQDKWFNDLSFESGYPKLYHTFASNALSLDLQDYIVPLPLDSVNAFHVLSRMGIKPEVVHVDGGHDYAAVLSDIRHWWQLLAPGGMFIGDDYDNSGKNWPGVKKAIDEYFARNTSVDFQSSPYKCRAQKPLSQSAGAATA